MKSTPEFTQHPENQNDGAATSPWDILQDGNNNNPFDIDSAPAPTPEMPESDDPFDLGDSTPAQSQPFTEEELAKDNPFDIGDSAPARPFTEEELAKDNPFNIDDSASAPEAQSSDNPFEV